MGKTKTLTDKQKEIILTNYIKNGKGQLYCSKAAGCSQYLVKKFLKEENIEIRNFSQAASLSNQNRAKEVNHKYFNVQSANMAWILGFIAADGCIGKDRNRIIINLSRTDREILEIIRKELNIENKIVDYENKDGFLCSSLSWTSKEHKDELAKYNIVPEKTLKLKPPTLLDKKFIIDYIRGYFDGDGSISTAGKYAIRWQIGGASKEILDFINDFLFEEYSIPKVSIQSQVYSNSLHNFYYIQYSNTSTRKIYDILYTPNSIYLPRKKEKFKSLI